MKTTQHLDARMSQRGIKKTMIDLAIEHGVIVGDRVILDRKTCNSLIDSLKQQQKSLEHAVRKGGITVAMVGDVAITAFRTEHSAAAR